MTEMSLPSVSYFQLNILINHCWCSDSIWGGIYSCRCIVSLDRIPEDKTYYDPPDPDWSIVYEHEINGNPIYPDRRDCLRVRQDVIDWLNANVKNRNTPRYVEGGTKGWAIGTDKYNSNSGITFRFFFDRQMDGMRFIKHWSHHKNPVSYLQYFKDIRKELDPKTGRLKRVPR